MKSRRRRGRRRSIRRPGCPYDPKSKELPGTKPHTQKGGEIIGKRKIRGVGPVQGRLEQRHKHPNPPISKFCLVTNWYTACMFFRVQTESKTRPKLAAAAAADKKNKKQQKSRRKGWKPPPGGRISDVPRAGERRRRSSVVLDELREWMSDSWPGSCALCARAWKKNGEEVGHGWMADRGERRRRHGGNGRTKTNTCPPPRTGAHTGSYSYLFGLFLS